MKGFRPPSVRFRTLRGGPIGIPPLFRTGWLAVASAVLLLASLSPDLAAAQLRAPQTGSVELGLLLRQLDGEKRVLMIAAHPDDEDTSLLAALALGQGVRTAYLSLSRGEGGQNLLGPELDEGLGLVRTGELLSARALDGAEQYFARAFDFGFSRTAEETFRHWPREELLRDVVATIRTFRPHVVISIFSGTPQDGHGHHQAAGLVTHEAVALAGDPAAFPEHREAGLDPWSPHALFRSTRFRPDDTTLEIATGSLDPLLGRSHFQVAMESRSRHRSQDMGAPQTPGPRSAGLERVWLGEAAVDGGGGVGVDRDAGLFAGIDTTLLGLASRAEIPDRRRMESAVQGYRAAIRTSRETLRAESPGGVLPSLSSAARSLDQLHALAADAPPGPHRTELVRGLEARAAVLSEALLAAGSIVVDLRLDRDRAAPGGTVEAQLLVWNGGAAPLAVEDLGVRVPDGWEVVPLPAPREPPSEGFAGYFEMDPTADVAEPPVPGNPVQVPPGDLVRWSYRLTLPPDARPSAPYFLSEPREGSLYRWPEEVSLRGRPDSPPPVTAAVGLGVGDETGAQVVREGTHMRVDKALGEERVPFFVVPALSVTVDPEHAAWPEGDPGPRPVTVRVANLSERTRAGEIELRVPAGWRAEPTSTSFTVPSGSEVSHGFRLAPDPQGTSEGATRARIRAVVRSQGAEYDAGVTFVDYPHLDRIPLPRTADLSLSRFSVAVRPGLRVGYLMGPGDAGMDALRDLGLEVEPLDPPTFRTGDLQRFDAIVLGVRAYETREDLLAQNERLLAYAREGGTVIVQYNKYEFPEGAFAPFPLAMRRPHDRVTDPEAPVSLLSPDHPVLRYPNRITGEDFEGWIQERGLYFLSEWDDRYTPLLEMSDPEQPANQGSLVVARVGEGAYVYTGLALFRQLPEGVPGAFRLFANLVSLQGADLVSGSDEAEGGGGSGEHAREPSGKGEGCP